MPVFGPQRLVGHYKLGGAYDTSRTADVAASGRTHRGQGLVYATADQMLVRTGRDGTDGLILFGAVVLAPSATATADRTEVVGVRAKGFTPGRAEDSVGLEFTRIDVSGRLTAAQRLEALQGAPLASGGLGGSPPGVQTDERSLEVLYNLKVCDGLRLIPDFQHVIRPDAAAAVRTAEVLAMRVELDF